MPNRITDQQADRARALVTDPVRAFHAGHAVRIIAWATLKLHRRDRIAALVTFRHHPGDAA